MEFIEYFKEREKDLIKAVGEKEWEDNKVYYVEEIIEIVNEWQLKFLPISRVSNLLCGFFGPKNDSSSATICKHCGREKWMHPKVT
jgi:hypothetical protein